MATSKPKKELQNLEDAGDELLMLEDDTAPIPYPYYLKKKIQRSHVGSVVSLSHREHSSSDPFFCHKGQLFAFLTLLTYRIGEVFIHLSSEETQEYLEIAKSKLQEEVKLLESQSGEVKALLGDLKVKLYAKFGNNINLEAEEE
ncbi:Prefoldin subunit 4 [Porites harrisoni]